MPRPKLTPTIRALQILTENRIEWAHEFALLMWPDSDGWHRVHKAGAHGSARGGMMPKVGGGFLGRLYWKGLVSFGGAGRQYHVTSLGHLKLAEYISANLDKEKEALGTNRD